MGIAEAALAQYRMSRGEAEGVYDLIGASLEHVAEARHIASTILTLEVIAELGIQGGAIRTSVELMAATAAIRSSMGTRVPPQAAARLEQLLATGRQHLGAGSRARSSVVRRWTSRRLWVTDTRCSQSCVRPRNSTPAHSR